MGVNRSKQRREKDLERTAELYLRGVYQSVIAKEIGVSQVTISKDIKELFKRWRDSSLIDINDAKARELARIDELERTYWAEWLASKNPLPSSPEAQENTEAQLGDPAYLRGVQWCVEKRSAIVGFNAPTKVKGPGKDGAIKLEHTFDDKQYNRGVSTLADALGAILSQSSDSETNSLDTPE